MTEDEGLKALLGDDAAAAARAEAALWEMWHRSGDREIDALLREGIALMERRDLLAAEAIFARMIAQAPAFAEGWNKRATVRYVAENYEGSISDCEETLSRNPHHFGALVGRRALLHGARTASRGCWRCFDGRSPCILGSAEPGRILPSLLGKPCAVTVTELGGGAPGRGCAGGVELTTRRACAAPRRLGSIWARVVRRSLGGNGSLDPSRTPPPRRPDSPSRLVQ